MTRKRNVTVIYEIDDGEESMRMLASHCQLYKQQIGFKCMLMSAGNLVEDPIAALNRMKVVFPDEAGAIQGLIDDLQFRLQMEAVMRGEDHCGEFRKHDEKVVAHDAEGLKS